ncbi:hypothetical protein ABPG72_003876 [Tetrahymena utriculariae]
MSQEEAKQNLEDIEKSNQVQNNIQQKDGEQQIQDGKQLSPEEELKLREKKAKKALNAKIYDLQKKLSRGIQVISQTEGKTPEELFSFKEATSNLFVLHFGIGEEVDYVTVKDYVNSVAGTHKLTVFPGLGYGYIQFDDVKKAEQTINSLERFEQIENCHYKEMTYEKKTRPTLFLYAHCKLTDICQNKNNDFPEASRKVDAPGLLFQEEFITQDYEKLIMEEIDKKEWNRLAKRKVQHYGYEFLYGINSINKDNKKDPIPDFLNNLMQTISKEVIKGEQPELDQLTINDYYPGDGIAPHFDTHSPFEEKIVIVSLNSGIVMSFKSYKNEEKHLFLPPRSILVLSGEVRYAWFHSIASRKVDKVEGDFNFRRRRVSLTFRTVQFKPCRCAYPFFCEDQGYDPVTMKKNNPLLPRDYHAKDDSTKVVAPKSEEEQKILDEVQQVITDGKPTNLEQKYVYEVYEKIAPHFSHTRYNPWPKIESFLKGLEPGSLVADIGCGNGKYLDCHNGDIYMIGTDRSENLISLARNRGEEIQVFSADCLKLPWVSSKFDNAISIAVIHHFSTPELRIHAINEILRILKVGGEALIYVWAFEQTEKSFSEQDVFVPWNLQNKYEDEKVVKGEIKPNTDIQINEAKQSVVYKRYYHVFKKGELEELISRIPNCKINDSYYDHANWVVKIEKTSE